MSKGIRSLYRARSGQPNIPGAGTTFDGTYGCCTDFSGEMGESWRWIGWVAVAGGQAMRQAGKEGFRGLGLYSYAGGNGEQLVRSEAGQGEHFSCAARATTLEDGFGSVGVWFLLHPRFNGILLVRFFRATIRFRRPLLIFLRTTAGMIRAALRRTSADVAIARTLPCHEMESRLRIHGE